MAQKAKSYIRQLLDHSTTIYIYWYSSHCNIQGNKLADALAKQGLDSDPGPEAFISFSHLRQEAKADVISKWQQDWWYFEQEREEQGLKARGLGTQYRLLVEGKLSFSLKPKLPNLPRKHQSAYIQLKTGIGNLRPYLVKIGKADSRACRQGCEEEENTEHLVLCCTKYNYYYSYAAAPLQGMRFFCIHVFRAGNRPGRTRPDENRRCCNSRPSGRYLEFHRLEGIVVVVLDDN